MGFRFRRSMQMFPGVRVNLSGSGISTTFGVPGAHVTVGPSGSRLSVGLPGSGLSYQQPLAPSVPPSQPPRPTHTPVPPPPSAARGAVHGEIRSAANDALTSVSLRDLRDLLAQAYAETQRLERDTPAADKELKAAQTRATAWSNGILLKHLLKKKYQAILDDHSAAQAERRALDEEIEKCRVALEIDMDGGIETTYGRVVETFRALAACERCWDNVAAVGVDKSRERSSADRAISRRPVNLDLRPATVIAPSRPALHFQNANGGDLYLLPGLVLVLGSERDFALLRLTEVRVTFDGIRFYEEEGVPADSQVVGQTWRKVNKDGSPDRRFANNYQIPIVQYGLLTFTSASGLNEEFMFSHALKAKTFADAFATHRATLPVA